jgi:hypothetical protein
MTRGDGEFVADGDFNIVIRLNVISDNTKSAPLTRF